MDFNGIHRLYLPLRPKAGFSPGRKTPPEGLAPSAGLRPLNVSRVKCGGLTLSLPLSATMYETYDMPTIRLYERIAEGLISTCRKPVVVATGSSPFKVRDNQRPERTMSGVVREMTESSIPVGSWLWRGNPAGMNCCGDRLHSLECASEC